MNVAQGNLVLIGLHTKTPQVFWNGQLVEGIRAIKVNNDSLISKVQLTLGATGALAEMAAAGIEIKVGA
jgi:hypothetical protein